MIIVFLFANLLAHHPQSFSTEPELPCNLESMSRPVSTLKNNLQPSLAQLAPAPKGCDITLSTNALKSLECIEQTTKFFGSEPKNLTALNKQMITCTSGAELASPEEKKILTAIATERFAKQLDGALSRIALKKFAKITLSSSEEILIKTLQAEQNEMAKAQGLDPKKFKSVNDALDDRSKKAGPSSQQALRDIGIELTQKGLDFKKFDFSVLKKFNPPQSEPSQLNALRILLGPQADKTLLSLKSLYEKERGVKHSAIILGNTVFIPNQDGTNLDPKSIDLEDYEKQVKSELATFKANTKAILQNGQNYDTLRAAAGRFFGAIAHSFSKNYTNEKDKHIDKAHQAADAAFNNYKNLTKKYGVDESTAATLKEALKENLLAVGDNIDAGNAKVDLIFDAYFGALATAGMIATGGFLAGPVLGMTTTGAVIAGSSGVIAGVAIGSAIQVSGSIAKFQGVSDFICDASRGVVTSTLTSVGVAGISKGEVTKKFKEAYEHAGTLGVISHALTQGPVQASLGMILPGASKILASGNSKLLTALTPKLASDGAALALTTVEIGGAFLIPSVPSLLESFKDAKQKSELADKVEANGRLEEANLLRAEVRSIRTQGVAGLLTAVYPKSTEVISRQITHQISKTVGTPPSHTQGKPTLNEPKIELVEANSSAPAKTNPPLQPVSAESVPVLNAGETPIWMDQALNVLPNKEKPGITNTDPYVDQAINNKTDVFDRVLQLEGSKRLQLMGNLKDQYLRLIRNINSDLVSIKDPNNLSAADQVKFKNSIEKRDALLANLKELEGLQNAPVSTPPEIQIVSKPKESLTRTPETKRIRIDPKVNELAKLQQGEIPLIEDHAIIIGPQSQKGILAVEPYLDQALASRRQEFKRLETLGTREKIVEAEHLRNYYSRILRNVNDELARIETKKETFSAEETQKLRAAGLKRTQLIIAIQALENTLIPTTSQTQFLDTDFFTSPSRGRVRAFISDDSKTVLSIRGEVDYQVDLIHKEVGKIKAKNKKSIAHAQIDKKLVELKKIHDKLKSELDQVIAKKDPDFASINESAKKELFNLNATIENIKAEQAIAEVSDWNVEFNGSKDPHLLSATQKDLPSLTTSLKEAKAKIEQFLKDHPDDASPITAPSYEKIKFNLDAINTALRSLNETAGQFSAYRQSNGQGDTYSVQRQTPNSPKRLIIQPPESSPEIHGVGDRIRFFVSETPGTEPKKVTGIIKDILPDSIEVDVNGKTETYPIKSITSRSYKAKGQAQISPLTPKLLALKEYLSHTPNGGQNLVPPDYNNQYGLTEWGRQFAKPLRNHPEKGKILQYIEEKMKVASDNQNAAKEKTKSKTKNNEKLDSLNDQTYPTFEYQYWHEMKQILEGTME